MNNKSLIALFAVVALVGGAIGGYAAYQLIPQLGGAYAGGVTPSQLFTGSASGGANGNGYVQPVGSAEDVAINGEGVGGTSLYNAVNYVDTASGTPASVITLGPLGSTTSTATTSITLPNTAGLALGAICDGGSATTTVYIDGCTLQTTDGVTGTALVAYANLTNANLSVPTSTVFRIKLSELPY